MLTTKNRNGENPFAGDYAEAWKAIASHAGVSQRAFEAIEWRPGRKQSLTSGVFPGHGTERGRFREKRTKHWTLASNMCTARFLPGGWAVLSAWMP